MSAQTGAAVDVDAWRRAIRADCTANYHLEMGVALKRASEFRAAAEHFRRGLEAAPKSGVLHHYLIESLRRSGQTGEAEAAGQAAAAVVPDYEKRGIVDEIFRSIEAGAGSATYPLLSGSKDGLDAAIESLRIVEDLRRRRQQANWSVSAGQWNAETLAAPYPLQGWQPDAAARIAEVPMVDPEFAERLAVIVLGEAMPLYQGQCYLAAFAAFSWVERLSGTQLASPTPLFAFGVSAMMTGHWRKAGEAFEGLVKNPAAGDIGVSSILCLGAIRQAQGRYEEAVEWLKAYHERFPQPEFRYFLAVALLFADRPKEAAILCSGDESGRALLLSTAAALALDDLPTAAACLDQAGGQDLVPTALARHRAALELHRGNHGAALQAIDQALAEIGSVEHPLRGLCLVQRGSILRAAGRMDEAVETFRQAAALSFRTPWAAVGLTQTLLDLKQTAAARDAAAALDDFPEFAWGLATKARLLQASGCSKDAGLILNGVKIGPVAGWADFLLGGPLLIEKNVRALG